MSRRPAAVVVLAAVLAALVLIGCGVPTETKARAIATDDDLTEATTPTTPPGPTARNVILFFVKRDHLSQVSRPVEQVPSVQVALTQLLAGVTAADKNEGLLSSIPPDTSMLSLVSITDDVATVNLNDQFKLEGDSYVQACAQIVYTVTANSAATRVRFQVEGKPTSPPTEKDGNLDVVSEANYRSLAP